MKLWSRPTGLPLVLALGLGLTTFARAGDLQPLLGEKGAMLYEENFDAAELARGWNLNAGEIKVQDGALRAREKASDKHAGAFRRPIPVQDCAVQVDFKLDSGTKFFHLGYDPAPRELTKKGHLFSVSITPSDWSLIEHVDKSNPQSRNKVLAVNKTSFEAGQWYTLLLETKGDHVLAQIAGKEPLKGSSSDFHVKKPGLVFRVAGPDDQAVNLDNIKVWELK